MEPMTTGMMAAAVKGRMKNLTGKEKVTGMCIDTRKLKRGQVFVALSGSRTHGQQFIKDAQAKGAVASMVDQAINDYPVIKVKNSRQALGRLAAAYRARFQRVKVIGITGSSGKTTVKEMIACILGKKRAVLMSQGNFNNDLGLPLSLFNLEKSHRLAVLEMGMNAPGEIKRLARIAKPVIGVITNIGDAHLGNFKNKQALANAKLELLQELPENGTAVLNSDDSYLQPWLSKIKAIGFGVSPTADIRLMETKVGLTGTQVRLGFKKQEALFKLRSLGEHHAWNAAAAVAAAIAAGDRFKEACQALDGFRPQAGMRTEIKKLGTSYVINDAYNSNPQSAAAAIRLLDQLKVKGPKTIVLGDMLELGASGRREHERLGQMVAASGIDCFVGTGPLMVNAVNAAKAGGHKKSFYFRDIKEAGNYLNRLEGMHQVILLKGSRGMAMEQLLAYIKK